MTDKETTVILKMSADFKATIGAAADALGLPLTTFIVDAALKRAQQVQSARLPATPGAPVPEQFRALCTEAAGGAANGYATPGWYLAAILGGLPSGGLDADSWSREVDALKALLANRDDEAAWRWLEQHLPDCVALVPARRREQFLFGVRRAYEEDLINP